MEGLPQEVASDRSLAALLPVLRADLVAYQTYNYWPDVLLECP
jgi:surfactin synthase thioesterase subunit